MKYPRKQSLNKAFLTGIHEIDIQHRNLIDLVNEAGNDLSEHSSPKKLKHLVQELLSYAIYHFETEELLMAEYGYKEERANDAEAHVRSHREFSARVVAMHETLQKREYVDTNELLNFLVHWVNGHIMETDKKLAQFVMQKRSGDRRVQ